MKGNHCAAAIIPQSNGQSVEFIHVLWLPDMNHTKLARIAELTHQEDRDEPMRPMGLRRGFVMNPDAFTLTWHMMVQPIISVLKLQASSRPTLSHCACEVSNKQTILATCWKGPTADSLVSSWSNKHLTSPCSRNLRASLSYCELRSLFIRPQSGCTARSP
jgi:hypothetical protein